MMELADYDGWVVLEWGMLIKASEDGSKGGAEFIKRNILAVTEKHLMGSLWRVKVKRSIVIY
jgi:hypothetical protein